MSRERLSADGRPGDATLIFVVIRPATPEDALAIAAVHVDAWKAAYRGIVPDEFLDSLSIEQRSDAWRQILSEGSPENVMVAQAADSIVDWI